MKDAETAPLVFVRLYVMIGDADDSIEGSTIMPLLKWEKDVAAFNAYLKKENITSVHNDGEYGGYEMNLENYTVKPITQEEAAIVKKFIEFNKYFRMPTDFIS